MLSIAGQTNRFKFFDADDLGKRLGASAFRVFGDPEGARPIPDRRSAASLHADGRGEFEKRAGGEVLGSCPGSPMASPSAPRNQGNGNLTSQQR